MKNKKVKLKKFHIETTCDASLHFFTRAENHKKALRRLETTSQDFKSISKDSDFTIKVTEIK